MVEHSPQILASEDGPNAIINGTMDPTPSSMGTMDPTPSSMGTPIDADLLHFVQKHALHELFTSSANPSSGNEQTANKTAPTTKCCRR